MLMNYMTLRKVFVVMSIVTFYIFPNFLSILSLTGVHS